MPPTKFVNQKVAPWGTKKISISNELSKVECASSGKYIDATKNVQPWKAMKTEDAPTKSETNMPSKELGATQHLQESLAQLEGALAEWECCMPSKDMPESKAAAHVVNTQTQIAGIMSQINSLMEQDVTAPTITGGAKTVDEKQGCEQQLLKPRVPETIVPCVPGVTGPVPAWQPAWQAQASMKHQQPWHRTSNQGTGPKQGKQQPYLRSGYNQDAGQARDLYKAPAAGQTNAAEAEDMSTGTLRSNLQELDQMPAERVIIVRKINRLGLESPTILEKYFAQHGSVEKVLVCHPRTKSRNKPGFRPAAVGFILMSSAKDTNHILNLGHEQVIEGATITVQPYEARIKHCFFKRVKTRFDDGLSTCLSVKQRLPSGVFETALIWICVLVLMACKRICKWDLW